MEKYKLPKINAIFFSEMLTRFGYNFCMPSLQHDNYWNISHALKSLMTVDEIDLITDNLDSCGDMEDYIVYIESVYHELTDYMTREEIGSLVIALLNVSDSDNFPKINKLLRDPEIGDGQKHIDILRNLFDIGIYILEEKERKQKEAQIASE